MPRPRPRDPRGLCRAGALHGRRRRSPAPGPPMSAVRVLLVDDNSTFRRLATRFLAEHDEIEVVGALRGGRDALAQIHELRPDVVLIDLAMPDLSGLQTIPHLRAARAEVGIIVLTLLATEAYRQAALDAGADAFVAKPNLTTELLPAIRRVVAGRRSRPSSADG